MDEGIKGEQVAAWGLSLKLPEGWSCDKIPSCEGEVSIKPPDSSTPGSPTVIMSLEPYSVADNIESVVDDRLLRLNAEYGDFEIVTKSVQKTGKGPRGVLLIRYRRQVGEHLTYEMVVPYAERQWLLVRALSGVEQWKENKDALQIILSSIQVKPPDREVEVVFSEEEPLLRKQTRGDSISSLFELLRRDYDKRDSAWFQQLLALLKSTDLHLPMRPLLKGPDGFPYYAAFTNPQEGTGRIARLEALLTEITEEGAGFAVDPLSPHTCVFSMGELWYFREMGFQEFVPPASWAGGEQDAVQIGPPPEDVMPAYARRALKNVLKYSLKVKTPMVILARNSSVRPPKPFFIFNFFPDDSAGDSEFEKKARQLLWYTPPHLRPAFCGRRDFNESIALKL